MIGEQILNLAGLAGALMLVLAFIAALSGAGDLGWLLVAVASFLFALSISTGSRATLRDR